MKFTEWLVKEWDKDSMLPPALDAQTAINFLKDYLVGEEWCSALSMSTEQINVEIVFMILCAYSKTFRKEKKEWEKFRKKSLKKSN